MGRAAWGMIDPSSVKGVIAAATPRVQPLRKLVPVACALGDISISIAAITGTGLIAIPRASGIASPISCVKARLS